MNFLFLSVAIIAILILAICRIIRFRIPNYLKRFLSIFVAVYSFYLLRFYIVDILTQYHSYTSDGLSAEVIGGLTTSAIIFIFYVSLMPIIEVSPKIIRYENGSYCVKIYNSSVFAAFDVSASFTKVTPVKADVGKHNVVIHTIETTLRLMEYLPSMFNPRAHRSGNTFATVYKVIGDEDIGKVLADRKDHSYYRLTISCKNGFTGLRKIINENYTYKSSVVTNKEFASGATFKRI